MEFGEREAWLFAGVAKPRAGAGAARRLLGNLILGSHDELFGLSSHRMMNSELSQQRKPQFGVKLLGRRCA